MELLFNKKYILRYKFFWIICGICLGINLVFYVSVITRQKMTIAGLQQKYTQTRRSGTSGLHAKTSSRELRSARQSWNEFREKLPPVTMVTVGIKELIRIVGQYESSNKKLIFKPKKVDQLELWKYSTEVTMTETYENMRKLLAEIQNSPHLFCIEKLLVAHSKAFGKVDLTLGITMYSRLDNDNV